MVTQITPIRTPPTPADTPELFEERASNVWADLYTAVPQMNAQALENNQAASAAEAAKLRAITEADLALGYKNEAANSRTLAQGAASTAVSAKSDAELARDAAQGYAAIINPSHLLERANHTGEQAISTVTGLQTALNGKLATTGGTLSGDLRIESTTGAARSLTMDTGGSGRAAFIAKNTENEGYFGVSGAGNLGIWSDKYQLWLIRTNSSGSETRLDFAGSATTASAANANLTTSGVLSRSTSSLRYKKALEAYEYARALGIVSAAEPFFYRSHGSKLDPAEYSYYGLAAEQLALIDPRFVHWGYSDDDYETVTVTRIEQRQATEIVEAQEQYIEIEEGRAVVRNRTVQHELPLFDEYPVFDESGKDLGRVHRVPRMVDVEVQETDRQVKPGAVLKPTGVMYDRITLALLMVLQREVLGIDRNDELSPELDALADQYCPDRLEAANG